MLTRRYSNEMDMSGDRNMVDQILDDLGIQRDGADGEAESSQGEDDAGGEEASNADRLAQLHEAGAITDEEYEVLQSHLSESDEEDDSASAGQAEFGQPIVTSEGTDMDFSIVGVIEDVDTTNLTHEYGEDGGPGRTLVFWQIYNHSSEEILLKHKHIEHIGEDQIAYNRDANPLHVDNFGPGWRTENWEEIAEDTRIRYVSCIEIPVRLGAVKVNGYCSDVHNIEITDNMFFHKSEAPVKADI